jgi:[acyl-carrier-protein] S-malonyltransferase
MLFPGQGSQKLGMLSELAGQYSVIEKVFSQASEAIGLDLWDIAQSNPNDKMNRTEITQPLVLTASYALYQVALEERFPVPELLAGHSLGEYTALVVSNVLAFQDAVSLVHYRGQLMQQAVPIGEGAMAAIMGLEDEQVNDICDQVARNVGTPVEAVNFNAPGQIVIAGNKIAVEKAMSDLKVLGAKVISLAVSVPAHSSLMKPAAERLEQRIDDLEFHQPVIPIVQNVSAKPVEDLSVLKQNLIYQLYSPVLWSQSIKKLAELKVQNVLECGPGKVLSGLNKRIDKSMSCFAMDSLNALQKIRENFVDK